MDLRPSDSSSHTVASPTYTSSPSPSMTHHNDCNDIDIERSHDVGLPKVLLLIPPNKFTSDLQRHFSHKFHFLNLSSLPLHHSMASVTALICYGGVHPITPDVLRLLPSLRFIFTPTSGADHIDLSECCRLGVQVAGAGNTYSEDVADLAVGLLIDVMMKISATDRNLRRRVQPPLLDFPRIGSKVCHLVFFSFINGLLNMTVARFII